jgi:hypothetical protein
MRLFEVIEKGFETQFIIMYKHDCIVVHTTGESAAKKIRKTGFDTGKTLGVAEKRSAIYFSDPDVNAGLYARNRDGDTYAGENAATIAINIKGLRLLNMTYKKNGKFVNYLKYQLDVVKGDLDKIPLFVSGEIDGTISFLEDGQIYEICLPKEIANKLL